jgi:hypothetical protein
MSRVRSLALISLAAAAALSGRSAAEGPAFSGLLGGSLDDGITAMAVAADGSVFVTGRTDSSDLPVKNPHQPESGGGADAFVARLEADGTLSWCTYLGGAGDDKGMALVLDATGVVWVGGETQSADFPVLGAYQPDLAGVGDGFVARLDAVSGALLAATYLGGTGEECVKALVLDGNGAPWAAGFTDSADLPVTWDAFQSVPGGGHDGFLVRLAPDGASLEYATYLGGSGRDVVQAAVLDGPTSVAVAGVTDSEDFPVALAAQAVPGGGADAFLLRLDASSGTVIWSTYLGGSGDDEALSLAVDPSGAIAVGGATGSEDFPVTEGAFQETAGGGRDGFLAVLTGAGALEAATLLGGVGEDEILALAWTPAGALLAGGSSSGGGLPVRAAPLPDAPGGEDGFLARFPADLSSLACGSYLGTAGMDAVLALAAEGIDGVLAAGRTDTAGSLMPGAGAPVPSGASDAFLGRFLLAPPVPGSLSVDGVTHRQLVLHWEDPTGGREGIEIERRVGAGDFAPVASLDPGTGRWTDEEVVPGGTHVYRVRGVLDGVATAWSAGLQVFVPVVPPPAIPGTPVLEVLGPHAVRVSWEDRSDDEITFEIFRSMDGGAPSLVKSITSNSTTWIDGGVSADRTWTYRVRAVGVPGPSAPSAPASAETPSSLDVHLVAGKRNDGPKYFKDSVQLVFSVAAGEGADAFDPSVRGLTLRLGDGDPVLALAAGAPGWKTARNGRKGWKSAKGASVKASVAWDPVAGTLTVKVAGLELAAAEGTSLDFRVDTGADAGLESSDWTETKPGRWTR